MKSGVNQKSFVQMLVVACLGLAAGGAFGKNTEADTPKKPIHATAKSRAALKTTVQQPVKTMDMVEATLTPAELSIAQLIHEGSVACELGVYVNVKADAAKPGYFDVQSQKFKFRMIPVVTSTGAIRLEDAHAGAVWLQLANKSMLMSQKLGSRLADECKNPAQHAVAAAMLKTPPVSLLEPLPPAVQPKLAVERPVTSPLSASN